MLPHSIQSDRSFQSWTATDPHPAPTIPQEARRRFDTKHFVGFEAGINEYVIAVYLDGVMLERWQVHGNELKVAVLESSTLAPMQVYYHFNPIAHTT